VNAMKNLWRNIVAWIGGADLAVLASILAILVGLWVFIGVAYGVTAGTTLSFDVRLLQALRDQNDPQHSIGPRWLEEVGRDFTALGGAAGLFLLTLAVCGYLAISSKWGALAFLLAATLGGLILSTLLKDSFHRPRPDVVPWMSQALTSSFPSGHSLNSAVVYLTLGSLLARLVAQRRLKLYFLGVALLLTFLVGISRVYMGVHYPTDVLAGWSVGVVWALSCSLAVRWLQQHGAVEQQAL
jgi:undecaprenyl-diphosphatase